MSNLIGLSLSFCVSDIAAGRVNIENVDTVVTGTNCQSEEDWQFLIDRYSDVYWSRFPKKALEVLARLRAENKILQYRETSIIPDCVPETARNSFGVYVGRGHWVRDSQVLTWTVRGLEVA